MLSLVLASILGGVGTAIVGAPALGLWAVAAAPLGGSLAAAGAALLIAAVRSNADQDTDLDAPAADHLVADLRDVLRRAERPALAPPGSKPRRGDATFADARDSASG